MALTGGKAGFTALVVQMMIHAVLKTHVWGKNIFLEKSIVAQIVEHEQLGRIFKREWDKQHRQPVARFCHAVDSGVTISALNKLRFAANIPSMKNLYAERRAHRKHIEGQWCPSSAELVRGTTRTCEEQQEQAQQEVGLDDDDDDELPDEEAMESPSAAIWETIDQQGYELLRAEYGGTPAQIADKWSGGLDAGAPFEGCNVVHACAVNGELHAFAKALVTDKEVFLDELLTAEGSRRQGLADQAFLALLLLFPAVEWVRLMVKVTNEDAIKKYRKWGMTKWTDLRVAEADAGCMFMRARRETVVGKLQGRLHVLPEGMSIFKCAVRPVDGFELDHVIFPAQPPEAADDVAIGEGDGDDEVQTAEPTQPDDGRAHLPFHDCTEDDRMARLHDPSEAPSSAPTGKRPAPAHGVKHFIDALCMTINGANMKHSTRNAHFLLLYSLTPSSHRRVRAPTPICAPALYADEVVLPDRHLDASADGTPRPLPKNWNLGNAQRPGFKVTCDEAQLKNAPKGWKQVTTVIMQMLTLGVGREDESGNRTWRGLVKGLVEGAQSCARAFPLRMWFAKDDAVNVNAHVVPLVEAAMEVEDNGAEVDILQDTAPWTHTRSAIGDRADGKGKIYGAGTLDGAKGEYLTTIPGTKANKHLGRPREKLVRGVKLLPMFMFCFDGATTMAITGVSLQSNRSDPFTDESTHDMGKFHEIGVLRKGERLMDLAEKISPGCSSPTHRDHWLIQYIVELNSHKHHTELQAVTREPKRKPRPFASGIDTGAANILNDARFSDGRSTQIVMPYMDKDIQRLRYDHAKFKPGMNGDVPNIAKQVAQKDELIRLPVRPEAFARQLPQAKVTGRGGAPFTSLLGLCIIHCAMRTCENCLRGMLTTASSRFVAGKGKDRAKINELLNERLKKMLGKSLIATDQKGQLYKISLNGKQVEDIIVDLLSGSSEVLSAIRETYAALSLSEAETNMSEWTKTMEYWAKSMEAAYEMKATAEHRQIFRENIKFYVKSKSAIRPGICNWYDWHLHHTMTQIFDRYESLRAISQEGMEACQRRNNLFMRQSNGFANAGRVPTKIKDLGKAAVDAYKAARKAKLLSPAHWLWLKNMFGFYAKFTDTFERVEKLKREEKTCDWTKEFVPEWLNCIAITKISTILRAKCFRWQASHNKPGMYQVVTWTRRGVTYTVECTDAHSLAVANELAGYYRPVPVEESGRFSELEALWAQKKSEVQRRKRWAEQVSCVFMMKGKKRR